MKSLILKIELLEIFAGTYMKTELLQFLNVQNLSEWRKQMAKNELIEKWESKEGAPSYEISSFPVNPSLKGMYIAGYGVARKEILNYLKQLDEPKKVIFSHEEKFVADWLDGLKGRISDKKLSSGAAFMVFVGQQLECLYYNEYTLITDDVEGWLLHPENKVKLLNAIDNGYEV